MRRYSLGFTLIELLVVVAILGIISAIGVIAYKGYTDSAKKKRAAISFQSILLAQVEYKSNNGEYYAAGGCGSTSTNNIVNELFDGIDSLKKQDYTFCTKPKGDTVEVEAYNSSTGCRLKQTAKESEMTATGC